MGILHELNEPEIVEVERYCNWCGHQWKTVLTREELLQIIQRQPIADCPSCKRPT